MLLAGNLPLILENFSQKSQFLKFFSPWIKKNSSKTGWPLIYYWSKVCLGQVRAHLYLSNQTIINIFESIFSNLLGNMILKQLSKPECLAGTQIRICLKTKQVSKVEVGFA